MPEALMRNQVTLLFLSFKQTALNVIDVDIQNVTQYYFMSQYMKIILNTCHVMITNKTIVMLFKMYYSLSRSFFIFKDGCLTSYNFRWPIIL